jgi:ComF family protein
VNVLCRKCDDHHYDAAFACGLYEKALAASVLGLKETPKIFPTLRREIEKAMKHPLASTADLIIPVPLSPQRMLERGFNQADLIADVCSRALRVPVDKISLARSLNTPRNRTTMDAKARAASVKKAFKATRPKLIEGRSILLVDDVLTSGATASNCADALKKSGASRVDVFTLARAVLRSL